MFPTNGTCPSAGHIPLVAVKPGLNDSLSVCAAAPRPGASVTVCAANTRPELAGWPPGTGLCAEMSGGRAGARAQHGMEIAAAVYDVRSPRSLTHGGERGPRAETAGRLVHGRGPRGETAGRLIQERGPRGDGRETVQGRGSVGMSAGSALTHTLRTMTR